MTRHNKLAILVSLLVICSAPAASAWFSTTGAGTAHVSTGTLNAPSITTAGPGAGTVALTWSAVTAPASGTVRYYVARDGKAPAGDCATSTAPGATTSCTDSGVSTGSHSYTVTAVWRSWTTTSTTTAAMLASGAATRLVLGTATTTPTAGAADDLTITAKDAANNTVTAYTGDKTLTFSGAGTAPNGSHPTVSDKTGTARECGATTTIAFSDGVAAVLGAANGVMRLYKAGSAAVTVTDGSIGDSGLNVTVATAAARSLAFQVQPTNATAGAAIAPAVRVEINDAFGNPTSSTESVTVTSSAQTLSGTLTRSTVAGVATFNDLSMTKAGTYKLTATSTALTGATSNSFNITPAATAKLAFVSTAVSGLAFTSATLGPITVQRQDSFGNTTTTGGAITVGLSSNSTGIVRFALTPGGAPVTSVSIASGSASTDFFYGDTNAGSPTITAASTVLSSATQQETITAAAASAMRFINCARAGVVNITCSGQPIAMGNNSDITFNMRTVDAFGNPSPPVAAITITFANSPKANFSITAGAPASITPPATQSARLTLHHDTSNTSSTFIAHASSSAIADATLTVK